LLDYGSWVNDYCPPPDLKLRLRPRIRGTYPFATACGRGPLPLSGDAFASRHALRRASLSGEAFAHRELRVLKPPLKGEVACEA